MYENESSYADLAQEEIDELNQIASEAAKVASDTASNVNDINNAIRTIRDNIPDGSATQARGINDTRTASEKNTGENLSESKAPLQNPDQKATSTDVSNKKQSKNNSPHFRKHRASGDTPIGTSSPGPIGSKTPEKKKNEADEKREKAEKWDNGTFDNNGGLSKGNIDNLQATQSGDETASASSGSSGTGAAAGVAGAVAHEIKHQAKTTAHNVKEAGKAVVNSVNDNSDGLGDQVDRIETKIAAAAKSTMATATVSLVIKVFLAALLIFLFFLGVVASCIVMLAQLSPGYWLVSAVANGFPGQGTFTSDIGTTEPTYEQTCYFVMNMLEQSTRTAYYDTCYDEIYQICEEEGYDIELTTLSYNDTQLPYDFSEENSNFNFAEIFAIMSMTEEFDVMNFNYDRFKELLEDKEFQRCLYDLKVEPAYYVEVPDSLIPEHGSWYVDSDWGLHIRNEEGAETAYFSFDAAQEVATYTLYGEVTVDHYSLLKVFDYFELDPYAKNRQFPSSTNYEALSIYIPYTKQYDKEIFWGSGQTTPLKDYETYTGLLVTDVDNAYTRDIIEGGIIGPSECSNGVTPYSQGDPRWKNEPYNYDPKKQHTIGDSGCCITSFSMVATYFTGREITPLVTITRMREAYGGLLYRNGLANDFGFKQTSPGDVPFTPQAAIDELNSGRLLIIQIRKPIEWRGRWCKRDHFMVISGYEVTGSGGVFHIVDPNGAQVYDMPWEECAAKLLYYRAYGLY